MTNRERGLQGEKLAGSYLRKQGYRILEQNYRCRFGEIDLIAWDGNTMVFIEVKTRTTTDYGLPQEAVNREKQRRLSRLATYYLMSHNLTEVDCRFDVVAIILSENGNKVEVIKDAFPLQGGW